MIGRPPDVTRGGFDSDVLRAGLKTSTWIAAPVRDRVNGPERFGRRRFFGGRRCALGSGMGAAFSSSGARGAGLAGGFFPFHDRTAALNSAALI